MLPTPQTSTIFPYTTLFRSKLSAAQSELERLTQMGQRIEDLETLVEMGTEMNDKETLDEAAADLVRIKKDLDSLEVRTLLSGEFDHREAVVTIRCGAGGVDAADWAEMLMRMYLRWAERHRSEERRVGRGGRGGVWS